VETAVFDRVNGPVRAVRPASPNQGLDDKVKYQVALEMQLGMRALFKRAELVRAREAGKTTLLPAVSKQRHFLPLIAESI